MTRWGQHDISIHALVKRATPASCCAPSASPDFNPRPREEGDTDCDGVLGILKCISIHALVKRATSGDLVFHWIRCHFNPRPREEGDAVVDGQFTSVEYISIHALVKRATFAEISQCLTTLFQSTPS